MFAACVPDMFSKTEYLFYRCVSCGSIRNTCAPKPRASAFAQAEGTLANITYG